MSVHISDLGGSNKPQDENNKFGQQDGKVSVTHSSVAGVVGGAMGALAVIVIIIIAFVCYRRRKSSTRKEVKQLECVSKA